jgi:hypothetical protein
MLTLPALDHWLGYISSRLCSRFALIDEPGNQTPKKMQREHRNTRTQVQAMVWSMDKVSIYEGRGEMQHGNFRSLEDGSWAKTPAGYGFRIV